MSESEHGLFDNVTYIVPLPRNCVNFSAKEEITIHGLPTGALEIQRSLCKAIISRHGQFAFQKRQDFFGELNQHCEIHIVAKCATTVVAEELFWNLLYKYRIQTKVAKKLYCDYGTWKAMAKMSVHIPSVPLWLRSLGVAKGAASDIAKHLANLCGGVVPIESLWVIQKFSGHKSVLQVQNARCECSKCIGIAPFVHHCKCKFQNVKDCIDKPVV
ncbi:MAG: hypothetical protein GY928_13280 [Colwellia sp.]|nr:hypothetical protein [Colwellia sp.]